MDPDVRSLTAEMYAALSRGDHGWFERTLLREPDTVHIGGGAAYWNSAEGLIAALDRQAQEVSISWRAGDMVVQQRENVAWVADQPVLRYDDGSELVCRATLVWVRDGTDGEWKLAHSHLSVPID
jgi:ketosteroid isomerase-like protein